MPKQQLAINRFDGGLVTDINPRDLHDNQFSAIKGFGVDSIGGLKTLGKLITHATISANVDIDAAPSATIFNAGYGLFGFSSDRKADGDEGATDYLASTSGDYIQIWDSGGNWNNMENSVVDDETGFSITEEETPSTATSNHIWSFYAPDGNLRVCDGEFSNHNHTVKILNYISKKTYGRGERTSYPTTLAEVTIGGDWDKGNASIESGLDSKHLKMINLGSVTKGIVEGDATGRAIIHDISADNQNELQIDAGGIDHPSGGSFSLVDDYYNGLTCSIWHSSAGSIYGVIKKYTAPQDAGSIALCEVVLDPDGNGSGQSLASKIAASSATNATHWSFQIGQQEGYLWNKTLNENSLNRGVISADYGVTLFYEEKDASTGGWMPTSNVRYKFYHSTTFDASSGDLKQQESSPSVFTMYPTKVAAGEETHASVDEMYFCDNATIGVQSDNTVSTASTAIAINFGLIIRIRSDNKASLVSEDWNTNIGSGSYSQEVQTVANVANPGRYNFLDDNRRATGGRIYWASSEDGFKNLNLLMEYDLEKGMRPVGAGSGTSSIGGYTKWSSWVYPVASNPVLVGANIGQDATWYQPPILESYESITGFSSDAKLDAKWKTAVIANNRVYAANIKRKEKSILDSLSFTYSCNTVENSRNVSLSVATDKIKVGMVVTGAGISPDTYVAAVVSRTAFYLNQNATATAAHGATLTFTGNGWSFTKEMDPSFQDVIIKSPVGKYDTFPDSEGFVLETFNSSDGDSIIKLETFADRLLAFKKYRVQIWNLQKGSEFLEDEVLYNGLDGGHPNQACTTDFGIAWMNSKGVYFYDGNQIKSLTDNVIRETWSQTATPFWMSNSADIPLIAFDGGSKKLFCLKNSTNGGSQDESCLIYSFKTQSWTLSDDGSSFDTDSYHRFGQYKGELIHDNGVQVKSWSDSSAAGFGIGKNELTTKDIDFGMPGIRKKIYKVHITYRTGRTGSHASNVQVKYAVDGESSIGKTFKDDEDNNFLSNELLFANGWQRAELKPSSSKEANNIYSFRLGITCDGAVPSGFEIDDITIIYRTKTPK